MRSLTEIRQVNLVNIVYEVEVDFNQSLIGLASKIGITVRN